VSTFRHNIPIRIISYKLRYHYSSIFFVFTVIKYQRRAEKRRGRVAPLVVRRLRQRSVVKNTPRGDYYYYYYWYRRHYCKTCIIIIIIIIYIRINVPILYTYEYHIIIYYRTRQQYVTKRVETFNVLRASGQGVTIRGLLNTLAITI